ncbi:hypothetical protein ElyMa_004662700 [Elysia marginata]|uniref:Uncharacterized protein n=1 Tax=Elysia marginata TaxID=1093978 RepID=A0AAV4I2D4_9GAST|nr:hypothetical protein ElyMa_004662700 [Elysia marginata]
MVHKDLRRRQLFTEFKIFPDEEESSTDLVRPKVFAAGRAVAPSYVRTVCGRRKTESGNLIWSPGHERRVAGLSNANLGKTQ